MYTHLPDAAALSVPTMFAYGFPLQCGSSLMFSGPTDPETDRGGTHNTRREWLIVIPRFVRLYER